MSTSTPEYEITKRTSVLKLDLQTRRVSAVVDLQQDVATPVGKARMNVKLCWLYITIFD